MIPVLSVRGLTKVFEIPKREPITAVSNVTFDLAAGTALGVVGDSGCGKSTLVRLIMRLMPSTAGTILLKGHDITHLNERALREVYRTMQMVFQQPAASFDPRRTLGDGIGEPLRNQGCTRHEADRCAAQLLERCGLTADMAAGSVSVLPLPGRWRFRPNSSSATRQRVRLMSPWPVRS